MAQAKFTNEQTAVFRKCIRAGVDMSEFKNPKFSAAQMNELYLAKKAGVDISLYNSPNISSDIMRDIRRTATAGVDIEKLAKNVVATGKYNEGQTREILDAARRGLNIKNMCDPELNAFQMRQIKLGERYGLDTSIYATPDFNAEQMQKLRFELLVQKIISSLKEFFTETWNRFVNWTRETISPDELQEYAIAQEADITNDEIMSEAVLYRIAGNLYQKISKQFGDDEMREEAVAQEADMSSVMPDGFESENSAESLHELISRLAQEIDDEIGMIGEPIETFIEIDNETAEDDEEIMEL